MLAAAASSEIEAATESLALQRDCASQIYEHELRRNDAETTPKRRRNDERQDPRSCLSPPLNQRKL